MQKTTTENGSSDPGEFLFGDFGIFLIISGKSPNTFGEIRTKKATLTAKIVSSSVIYQSTKSG